MTDDEIVMRVIADEGGLVNNPADPGGVTNRGITRPAFTDFLRATTGDPRIVAGADEIRHMTLPRAQEFYRWLLKSSGIGLLPNADVRYITFDAAVNMGNKQGIRLLQRALGLVADGVIGIKTVSAVPIANGTTVVRRVLAEKMEFYGRLASGDLTDADRDGIPDRLEMLNGWLARTGRQMRLYA